MSGPARSPRRDEILMGLCGCVLALAYAANLLATFAHFLLVEHVRCVEHGVWVHVGDHGLDESESTAEHEEPGATHEDFRPVTRDPSHRHDHCASFGQSRTGHQVPAVFCIETQRVASAAEQVRMAPYRVFVARARYAFAPKTSPPSSARLAPKSA